MNKSIFSMNFSMKPALYFSFLIALSSSLAPTSSIARVSMGPQEEKGETKKEEIVPNTYSGLATLIENINGTQTSKSFPILRAFTFNYDKILMIGIEVMGQIQTSDQKEIGSTQVGKGFSKAAPDLKFKYYTFLLQGQNVYKIHEDELFDSEIIQYVNLMNDMVKSSRLNNNTSNLDNTSDSNLAVPEYQVGVCEASGICELNFNIFKTETALKVKYTMGATRSSIAIELKGSDIFGRSLKAEGSDRLNPGQKIQTIKGLVRKQQ